MFGYFGTSRCMTKVVLPLAILQLGPASRQNLCQVRKIVNVPHVVCGGLYVQPRFIDARFANRARFAVLAFFREFRRSCGVAHFLLTLVSSAGGDVLQVTWQSERSCNS